MCLSSGNAVDDDDDRFADDGSVYIYREGDSSPSVGDPPQGYDKQQEQDAEHGGGDESDRTGRDSFAPQGVDDDDRARRENDGKLWQDKRRLEPSAVRTREGGRSSSGHIWGVSGGDGGHRGASLQRRENESTPTQHGGGGGGIAAGVNSKEGRQGQADIQAWQEQQEQRRLVGPSGGADLANRKHMRSGGGVQQARAGVGRASEPLATTLEGRRKKNDRGFRGETPAEAFAVPVPGASYSARIDRGMQGRGGRDTTIARGLGGGDDAGALPDPSAKVRQTTTRLRNMILDRQASANRSIREVFGHFDRRRCGYVNVAEIRDALADLRLNLSPEEGKVGELQTAAMESAPRGRLAVFGDTRHNLYGTQPNGMQIAAVFCKICDFTLRLRKQM